MANYKFPLSINTWDKDEEEAIVSVVSSGQHTMGNYVANFEREFAERFGAKYCVMSNSGSSANLLMFLALKYSKNPRFNLADGDEVIVPAVSWATSYYPINQSGLVLRFCDIDRRTLNYDIKALTNVVSDKTRAILAVNLLGNSNDFRMLQSFCDEHDLILLEDNCESMGATYAGKMCGTFGVMGSFSTYFSHHISTIEGGLVLTDDLEMYELMRSLRSHGWTRHLSEENALDVKINPDKFYERFNFILPGYNLRPMEIQGALGISQLKKVDEIMRLRRSNARLYRELCEKHSFISGQKEVGQSSWFGFAFIIVDLSVVSRDRLVEKLDSCGVETRPIVSGNFIRQPVAKYLNYECPLPLINANYIHDNGFFIGNLGFDMRECFAVIDECFSSI